MTKPTPRTELIRFIQWYQLSGTGRREADPKRLAI
jgi:hypothetical protein